MFEERQTERQPAQALDQRVGAHVNFHDDEPAIDRGSRKFFDSSDDIAE
ncbi:MAG TPA: hypothetical protein VHV78_09135 [Gemmatimonadaceae bacterium]|nr:hypothetical protein [Gemmatimonadaceae bacterium]